MSVAVSTRADIRLRADMSRYAPAAGVALTCVATGSAAAITMHGPAEPAATTALGRALIVGVPLAAGLFARRRAAERRFGTLLIAAGLGYLLATLAEAQGSLPYSTGRVVGWAMEPLLLYLVLAFPSGRLTLRRIASSWSRSPECSACSTCRRRCSPATTRCRARTRAASPTARRTPSSLDHEPAFVDDVLRPLAGDRGLPRDAGRDREPVAAVSATRRR